MPNVYHGPTTRSLDPGSARLVPAHRGFGATVDRVTIESREEADQPLSGVFMLHASRSFEHRLDSGEVIRGKADPTLDLSSLVEWDLKPCIAHVYTGVSTTMLYVDIGAGGQTECHPSRIPRAWVTGAQQRHACKRV